MNDVVLFCKKGVSLLNRKERGRNYERKREREREKKDRERREYICIVLSNNSEQKDLKKT